MSMPDAGQVVPTPNFLSLSMWFQQLSILHAIVHTDSSAFDRCDLAPTAFPSTFALCGSSLVQELSPSILCINSSLESSARSYSVIKTFLLPLAMSDDPSSYRFRIVLVALDGHCNICYFSVPSLDFPTATWVVHNKLPLFF